MRSMRYLVAGVLAILAVIGTIYGIGQSGLSEEGALIAGLWSGLVIYPAAILVGAFVFWIVYAAMDPGSER